jgi:glucosamine--fructose-6-phosphate aminotransferase (isomerizing)
MCVLAGYIGDRPAASILMELLEKQEGLAGGYYTGLATVDGGRLHYRKVVGDAARLKAETDALSLPGRIGIAHSRTPSGGGVEWGHPFIACDGRLAYVAQGSLGFFEKITDLSIAGNELIAAGHTLRSASDEKIGAYPVLSNGQCVHVSDIMGHAVEWRAARHGDRLEAMRQTYMKWPAEIVGMTIHADDPERIVVACVNQPLVIGRDDAATYVASVGLALPNSVSWRMPMPANAAAVIRRDGVQIRPFDADVEPVDGNCPEAKAEAVILDLLAKTPGATWGKGYSATRPLWPDGRLTLNAPMAYAILERLYRSGRIRFESVEVPGMFNQGTAPQVRMYLNT